MNRFLAFTLFVFLTVLGHSQGTMNIYQSNGSILLLSLDNIDSVTYQLAPPPPLMQIHQPGGSVLSLAVADIDSITYSGGGSTGTALIVTLPPVNLSSSSAQCGGYISTDNGSPVLVRGVCWSETPLPTIQDNTTSDGSGTGTYTSTIIGLSPNTTYYGRAYALNGQGVSYGNLIAFATTGGGSPPTLSTTEVTVVNGTSARSGGTIITDGGETILARGVCWSIDPSPTTADAFTNNGSGTVDFISDITGLQLSTTYYVRAWATNIFGTGYGNEWSFTTTDGYPSVTTSAASAITLYEATVGVNVISNGGLPITASGVYWSLSPNPTTSDSVILANPCTLTGLTPNTTYYVRSFATNSAGTSYGNEVQFTTLYHLNPNLTYGSMSDVEGNTYATIVIGTQEWMAENLRTALYANGDTIPDEPTPNDGGWSLLETGAWGHFENNPQYDNPYGKLYNRYTIFDPRNVCPAGWHVPTDGEWIVLIDYLGGETVAGGKMKASTVWQPPNTGATNESGFSALPGGYVSGVGGFTTDIGIEGSWGGVISIPENTFLNHSLDYDSEGMNSVGSAIGFYIRCVRD